MTLENLALQGRYSCYDTMAAGVTTRLFDIRRESVAESMCNFQSIEHRMEFVSNIHGIEFINDSKASNINATWYALESMTKKVVWIVGGSDEKVNYNTLKDLVGNKVRAIICLGEDNSRVNRAYKKLVKEIYHAETMSDAVSLAYQSAKTGDVVLLSPACPSFDRFENYEDRGRQFKQLVKEL